MTLGRSLQHISDIDTVAHGGVSHQDVGYGAYKFAVLQNGTAGHALDNASRDSQQLRVSDFQKKIPPILPGLRIDLYNLHRIFLGRGPGDGGANGGGTCVNVFIVRQGKHFPLTEGAGGSEYTLGGVFPEHAEGVLSIGDSPELPRLAGYPALHILHLGVVGKALLHGKKRSSGAADPMAQSAEGSRARVKKRHRSDAGDALVELAFGSLAQHVEVTGVEVLNFGNSVVKEDLPETRFTYNGRETGATWREKALQRIEEIRTAPLTVKVIDSEGKPVHKAEVEIKMTRSDFIWGTAINEATLAGTDSVSDIYRMRLLELFNTGGIENGFKSGGWFWEPERKLNTLRSFEWLEKNGFRQRGHNLVWPGWKFNPSTTRYIAEHDSPDVFERFIKAQFYERMAYTKGRVIAWDVINEPMHEKDFFKILPPSVMVDWFKLARRLDPNAQLFINDYSMLNCVESPQNIKDYMKLIRDLRAQGAPIDAVGIQGHVGRQPRDPEQVLSDLDLLIPLGLPVQITEFDINTPDEELQADYTRDFLIAVYSHPVITGVTLWGFWEAKHWKPDAAMFRKDWTPKPNAKVWREWVTGKWKTHATAMTNDKGTVSMRGHLGEYAIYVCCQGKSTKVMCHLGKNGQEIVVNLD